MGDEGDISGRPQPHEVDDGEVSNNSLVNVTNQPGGVTTIARRQQVLRELKELRSRVTTLEKELSAERQARQVAEEARRVAEEARRVAEEAQQAAEEARRVAEEAQQAAEEAQQTAEADAISKGTELERLRNSRFVRILGSRCHNVCAQEASATFLSVWN